MTKRSIPSDATLEEASRCCAVGGKLLLPQLLAVGCTLARVKGVVQKMTFLVTHRFDICVQVPLWVLEKVSEWIYLDIIDLEDEQCITWLFYKRSSAFSTNFPHRSGCQSSIEFVLGK